MKNDYLKQIIGVCFGIDNLQIQSIGLYSGTFILKVSVGEDEYSFDLPYHSLDTLQDIIELAIVKTPAI